MSHYKPYPAYKDSGVEWLGQVPYEWKVEPLFALADERNESNEGMLEDNLLSLSYGSVVRKDIHANDGLLPQSFETYQIVRTGDIVFRLTDLQNDQRSLRTAIVQEVGIITSAYTAVTPRRINPPFFNYLLRAYDVQKVFYSMGGGMRQSMKFEDLRRIPILIPSMPEQIIIAAHLDRETARIDALIAKKTRFIELLREKRQALITHAVTKGLNPNVKMKDSGVEWLGEVPEHWVIKRFRDICVSISTGPFGTALGNDDYVTGGVPVINPSHIVDEQCSPDPDITVSVETAERLSFWAMRVGDLVTARRGELGRAAVIFDEQDGWICGTGSLRVRPNPSQALAGYLHTVLQSRYAREWLNLASVGATMANLNEGILGSLPLALPPSTSEQEQLLSSLATQSERLIKIQQKAALSVALLKERRSALITAAVTGQIDLRGAV